MSLTDHVGAVSQQAMQKLINRKSLNSNEVMIGYIETDDKHQQHHQQQQHQEEVDTSRRMNNKMKGVSPLKKSQFPLLAEFLDR